jgi:phenylacetate-CoA ligase
MFWNKDIETLDRGSLEELQLRGLGETFARCAGSAFYADLFRKHGIGGIGSFADLGRIPFTTKADLRSAFPWGFLCLPLEQVVRLHSSSGTTGNPTVIYHTRNDIDDWADLLARCMTMAGVSRSDVFQNMMGYGLFTGGLGFHYGAEKVGCLTIPFGPGNSRRQLWFMKTFGTTVVHILPSYALHLHTFLDAECRREDLRLRTAFIGAEPHTGEMRRSIERIWGIRAYNSYGLSEMCGPGVAFECPEQNGMHIWEDRFCVEIVDPKTGEVLPDGEPGELVLTTLRREANPLVRYRTRDLTRIIPGPCPCGRTHRRIDRISGRSDDMLIINGVNIFPLQIEQAIMKVPGVGTNYLVEIVKENFMDRICVSVEVGPDVFSGTLEGLGQLRDAVSAGLKSELGVGVVVKLVEPHSLPVAEGKAKRVIDKR